MEVVDETKAEDETKETIVAGHPFLFTFNEDRSRMRKIVTMKEYNAYVAINSEGEGTPFEIEARKLKRFSPKLFDAQPTLPEDFKCARDKFEAVIEIENLAQGFDSEKIIDLKIG